MTPPLAGIRVLDLSRVLAGPWCTQLLADLGAEVIKIERPGTGDDTRHWGPPWHGEGKERVAAYFLSANRGKKSAAIDFAKPEGAALVSVTVPCEELPLTTLVGLSVNAESVAEPGGGSGACAVNLRVTDQGPTTPAELMPRTRHHNRLAGSELVVKFDTATFWLTICGALNVLESSI